MIFNNNFDNKPVVILIGKNGSGKSFTLNSILKLFPNNSLYISEEGISKVANQKNKVNLNISTKKYIYTDDNNRGNNSEVKDYSIFDKSLNVINYCNYIKSRLENIINKSQGQKKLENIMNIFLNYNLNYINNILFDEPENFLDEEYLKVISELIKKLKENNFFIRIATHNSRLLSILNIEIDDIIICNQKNIYSINKKNIVDIFNEISLTVSEIKKSKKLNDDSNMDYKLNIHKSNIVFDNYLDSNLKHINFYSSLFYENILIVEGISDLEALKTIDEKLGKNIFIFSANGKSWIPFYAKLFLKLGKKVKTLIDSDKESNNRVSIILNEVLLKVSNLKIITNDPNLEEEYGIDINSIAKELSIPNHVKKTNSGWMKQISAYYFFNVKENWKLLDEKINKSPNIKYTFN